MNTKEAIEFVKNESNYNYNGQNEEIQNRLRLFNHGMEEVIKLLQRGEKYEAMWREIYEIASEFNFFPLMDKIKAKILPEGEE